ncbi:MAG: trigger factor [Patescibacteria group bacterium]
MQTKLKKLPKSQIEIDFELTAEEFSKYIDKALEHLKDHVKVDGFRQGMVPKEMVEKKVGQENLLMEAGDLAVKETYAKFVNENGIEPIGNPEVQIKKIAKGSEFLFNVKVAVLPEIELPNYKEIASQIKTNNISVNDQEIEDAVNYLQKSRAKFSQVDRPAENKDFVEIEYQNEHINQGKAVNDRFILGEGGFLKDFEDNLIGVKTGEEKEFSSKFPESNPNKALAGKESKFKVKIISVQKMELPEINDEFAKGLGVFDSLVALKTNLKEGITMEKTENERQRKRSEILSQISEKVNFDLPEKMVDYEKEKLFEDFKNHITTHFKTSFEEYLSSIKKTEEEIKNSYKLEAEKRLKNFLVLRQIGKQENVEVSNEELEQEVNKESRKYSPEQLKKPGFDIEQLKEYSRSMLHNEKVFRKLESLSNNS